MQNKTKSEPNNYENVFFSSIHTTVKNSFSLNNLDTHSKRSLKEQRKI